LLIKDSKNAFLLRQFAQSLSKVVVRLGPKDATTAIASALPVLTQAIKENQDPNDLVQLALCLSALAAHCGPEDASQLSAALTQAINKAKGSSALRRLAPEDLSALATHLGAKEAAAIAALAVADLTEAMTTNPGPVYAEPPTTRLSAYLSGVPPATEFRSRSGALSSAVSSLGTDGHPLTAVPFLLSASEPLPCRLSDQQLVELLKMPTCVGAARRVVLDHLGILYRRTFADPWEFVRFAKDQGLDLDFANPPQRPESAAVR
jgi:hypothetical protein